MHAVITADLINSRETSPQQWLPIVKEALATVGEEKKNWEIFRGDSIQLIIQPSEALGFSIRLKALVKQHPKLDIRQAIGIGEITHRSNSVSTSSGSAFIHSGEGFDNLKKSTLTLVSPWKEFNEAINTMLGLANLTMDNWKPTTAQIMALQLQFPEAKQVELAKQLNIHQSNLSKGLQRAGYDEINACISYYKNQLLKLC